MPTIEKLPKSQIKIIIELTPEDLTKYQNQGIAELSESLKIPGFRPGHVPEDIAKSHLGQELIWQKTLEVAIPQTYAETVVKEKILVVSKPQINLLTENPLKYEAIVAVLPEINFKKDPGEIKLKTSDLKVTPEEETEAISHLQKMYAKTSDTDEAIAKGHRAEVSFEGFDEKGIPLAGTGSKNHPVVIGEGMFLPDFENNLIGLKKDDLKEFDVTFPAAYHQAKFQGKKIHFKVTVHKVANVTLPELTDEFVSKTSGQTKTVADFKADLKKELLQAKESEDKVQRQNQFLEELIKISAIDLPDALIEEEIDFMLENTKMNLKSKGIEWSQYEDYLKEKTQDIRADYRADSEKHVRLRLILQKLFETNAIDITDDDINNHIKEIITSYPENEQKKVIEYYADETNRRQLKNRLKLDKLFAIYLK